MLCFFQDPGALPHLPGGLYGDFTSGSTAALKLVAEAFPWVSPGPEGSGSCFCYLTDSHTSVVGMRKITAAMNVSSIPVRPEDMWSAERQDAAAHYFFKKGRFNS